VLSSPFVRCQQTIEPLAKKLKLDVELSDALAEGAAAAPTLRLIEKLLDQEAVLCTHGDVLGDVLEHYASLGVKLQGDRLDKACTWVLDVVDGEVRRARYVPPPGR
jgi:8-oxo-dGTP diphosphatase